MNREDSIEREEGAAKFRVEIWTRDLPNTKHERICSFPGLENIFFFGRPVPKLSINFEKKNHFVYPWEFWRAKEGLGVFRNYY